MNIKKKVRNLIRQEAKEAIRESGVFASLKKLRQIVRDELRTALDGLQGDMKYADKIGGGGAGFIG